MSEFLCNLLIPGAAKSGTSSLHALLGEHPQILMSSPKEPQFFSFQDLYEKGSGAHNSVFDHGNTDDTRDADFTYYGESSQSYFVHEHAIERIQASLDVPKIILVLRHPVERLLSHYRWRYKHAVETRSLLQAIKESGMDTRYKYDPGFGMYAERGGGYVAFSRYSEYVPMWQDAFGEANVLLLRTEDLKRSQQRVASTCFDFLGLPDYAIGSTIERHKTSQTTRNLGSMPWYFQAAVSLFPRSFQKTSVYKRVLGGVLDFFTPAPSPSVSEKMREAIRERLTPDLAFYHDLEAI